jgi:hypothetical protein
MAASLILDISTAPLTNAAEFLNDQDFAAPANYKDPVKIAAFVAEAKADALALCALDPDMCRISGVGCHPSDHQVGVWTEGDVMGSNPPPPEDFDFERDILDTLSLRLQHGYRLISFNGLKFDWPVLNARARYLGINLRIPLDKYRNVHIDLYDTLTNHGALKGHSLAWWVRRHGWTDLQKPLDGAEEAKVFKTGEWAKLADSLRHDVEATRRLAAWCGVL